MHQRAKPQRAPRAHRSVRPQNQTKDLKSTKKIQEKRIDSLDSRKHEISSPQDLIDEGFNIIESDVKIELLQKLKSIDPYFFEKVVLKILKKMGYG